MNRIPTRALTLACCIALTGTAALAQTSFGVRYGSDACNNEPTYLTENDIDCTAVFAATNVWDFLNNLPRRISLEELNELNPALGVVTYDTVIEGITFVRVR